MKKTTYIILGAIALLWIAAFILPTLFLKETMVEKRHDPIIENTISQIDNDSVSIEDSTDIEDVGSTI